MDITISIENPSRQSALFGTADRHLRTIRTAFGVQLAARDGQIIVNGPTEGVQRAAHTIDSMQKSLRTRPDLPDELVQDIIERVMADATPSNSPGVDVFLPGGTIAPKNAGQKLYMDAMHQHDLTFCIGPAGTGKTFLAVAVAVGLLKQQRIKKIVLARPAVEAGERLGYLPGDLQAKVNPYLRPLFDAMNDMMNFEQLRRAMQNDVIEVVPLAFMRGRTLNHAAIILDEAQNSTPSQMLMFLTRLGHQSKMIVTGDDTQSDLQGGDATGLIDAIQRLEGLPGIATVRLSQSDIVRHKLVQQVVKAYTKNGDAR